MRELSDDPTVDVGTPEIPQRFTAREGRTQINLPRPLVDVLDGFCDATRLDKPGVFAEAIKLYLTLFSNQVKGTGKGSEPVRLVPSLTGTGLRTAASTEGLSEERLIRMGAQIINGLIARQTAEGSLFRRSRAAAAQRDAALADEVVSLAALGRLLLDVCPQAAEAKTPEQLKAALKKK